MRAPSNLPSPPRQLGEAGLDLWTSIQSDYCIEDSGGVEILAEVCEALDRAQDCASQIARDGAMIAGPSGPKAHPLLAAETSARVVIMRGLRLLGCFHEVVGRMGPGKNRHPSKHWEPPDVD